MDIVTILVAVAMGATLAALFSGLLGLIKEYWLGQQTEARMIVKKGTRTVAVLNMTEDEVDRFLREFKSDSEESRQK